MYATDFKYDDKRLSDYNCIICDFDATLGISFVSIGSKIAFTTQAAGKGKKYTLIDTNYDECLGCTFDICKNPDLYNGDEMEMSATEYREIIRWLNRKEFLPLVFLATGEIEGINSCYYDASFNVSKIEIAGKVYGLRVDMTTNRPFGYGTKKSSVLSFSQSDYKETKNVDYISDEIGYCYPDIEIKCKAEGTLVIKNTTANSTTQIKNCLFDEIINLKGEEMIITSSKPHKTLSNDFNYTFLRLINTLTQTENNITVSLPCEITISYAPIIKDAP